MHCLQICNTVKPLVKITLEYKFLANSNHTFSELLNFFKYDPVKKDPVRKTPDYCLSVGGLYI